VKVAWPKHLENVQPRNPESTQDQKEKQG